MHQAAPLSPPSKLSLNCFSSLSASTAARSSRLMSSLSLVLLSNLFRSIMMPLSRPPSVSPLISFRKSVPRTLTSLFVVCYLLAGATRPVVDGQLIINLKNRGGEVYQQAISTKENFIEVEYQSTDGNLVNQIIDFENVSIYFRFCLVLFLGWHCLLICIGQHHQFQPNLFWL